MLPPPAEETPLDTVVISVEEDAPVQPERSTEDPIQDSSELSPVDLARHSDLA
jgi:hypothetical protein